MFRFLPYLKKYRIYVILGPIFKLIEAVFELIVPIVTSLIIDKGVRQGDLTYVWHMGGVLIGLGAVGLGSALICQNSPPSLRWALALRYAIKCMKKSIPFLMRKLTALVHRL
ncbi:MAG: hypothetical protein ACLR13_05640 [Acutalibacteraceae bacterium]